MRKLSPIYDSINPYNEAGEINCKDRLFFDFDRERRVRDAWEAIVKLNDNLAKYKAGSLTVFSESERCVNALNKQKDKAIHEKRVVF